jgi:transposase
LVESYRTDRGPRQRTVAYLGQLDEAGRVGVHRAAKGNKKSPEEQLVLWENDSPAPEWVEVNASAVRVENQVDFGGPWLALELIRRLQLDRFLQSAIGRGNEDVPWATTALVLVVARLCDPCSELHIAEHYYRTTALVELLGVPAKKVYDERLYRALDKLLPHKEALEKHLKNRLGELFDLEYDLLLYDVTSTYFEGEAEGNPMAKRGYSRDKRSDCKQVCIGLVVSRCGMPIGYEVFDGNRHDSTTLRWMVKKIEARYGKANRIWVGDRGMLSKENIDFLKSEGRRYIIGAPKASLKQFERELLADDWRRIRDGLEVKLCESPDGDGEVFILCRSRDRGEKEAAMHRRFEERIEKELLNIQASCRKRKWKKETIDRRLGRLMSKNSRAAGLFEVDVTQATDGRTSITWLKKQAWREWARLSEGCYMLRSNVTDWTPEELWLAYIQLTEAEAAFRIEKSDLRIRPIWHQRQDRVLAHILVCFLAYVLWKTLFQMVRQAGLGDEPRRVLAELSKISLVDVVLPTSNGIDIRRRCVIRPTEHQAILLERLGLRIPAWKTT